VEADGGARVPRRIGPWPGAFEPAEAVADGRQPLGVTVVVILRTFIPARARPRQVSIFLRTSRTIYLCFARSGFVVQAVPSPYMSGAKATVAQPPVARPRCLLFVVQAPHSWTARTPAVCPARRRPRHEPSRSSRLSHRLTVLCVLHGRLVPRRRRREQHHGQ